MLTLLPMRLEDLLLGAGLATSRKGLLAFRGFFSATFVLCTTSYIYVSGRGQSLGRGQSTYGVLGCEPFVEWGLLPVYEAEGLLRELADEKDGMLSAPLQDLVECGPITDTHGILGIAP